MRIDLLLKWIVFTIGIVFITLGILAFTPVPFHMYWYLGEDTVRDGVNDSVFSPDYVIMYGGGGMPSESNLLRLYYTAEFANAIHKPIVLVHPEDSVCQEEMKRFLVNYGVSADSIIYMTDGSNTRSQTVCLAETFPYLKQKSLLVISSPEHLSRTLKCLRKCGFNKIRGIASFEHAVDFDLKLNKEKLHGNNFVPSVKSIKLRYTYWNYLELEIKCIREYIALSYYWLKDWI